MKNLNFLLIFLAFISLAGSCERRESDVIAMKVPGDAIIKGRITTANGAKPAVGLNITIFWEYDAIVRQKANVKTDENGYYSINLLVRPEEAKNGQFIFCLPDACVKGYLFCKGPDPDDAVFERTTLQRDQTFIANFNVPQAATLKFSLDNSIVYTPDYYYQLFDSNLNYSLAEFWYNPQSPPNAYQLERTVPADTPITIEAKTVTRVFPVVKLSSKIYNIPAIAPNQTLVQPISF